MIRESTFAALLRTSVAELALLEAAHRRGPQPVELLGALLLEPLEPLGGEARAELRDDV